MTRKSKKPAGRPEPFSGDRKLRSKLAGFPATIKTSDPVKSKAKEAEIKGDCSKHSELCNPNKIEADRSGKNKNKVYAGNSEIGKEEDDTEDEGIDLDEFDELSGESSKEEQQSDAKESNSEDEEISDDDPSDEDNAKIDSDDSGDESEGSELGNDPCNKTKPTVPATSETKSSKPTNEMVKVATGEIIAGKSCSVMLGDETENTQLGNDPLDNTKLMVVPVSKNVAGKAPNGKDEVLAGGKVAGKSGLLIPVSEITNSELENDHRNTVKLNKSLEGRKNTGKTPKEAVKDDAGKNGGKVNRLSRTRDSGELRTRSELKNALVDSVKLALSPKPKTNGSFTSNACTKNPDDHTGKSQIVEDGDIVEGLDDDESSDEENTMLEVLEALGGEKISSEKSAQMDIGRKNSPQKSAEIIGRNFLPQKSAAMDIGRKNFPQNSAEMDIGRKNFPQKSAEMVIGSAEPGRAGAAGIASAGQIGVAAGAIGAAAGSAWTGTGPRKSFAQLFKAGNPERKGYKLDYIDSEGDLLFEEEEVVKTTEAWGHALVGYIAGKNPSYKAVIGYCKSWTHKCRVDFDASGWIVVKFEKEEDLTRVLEGGPYLIYGKPFIVKSMPRYFRYDKSEICKAQVWVKLPHLPLELWNEQCLSKIGSRIGDPIQVDSITALRERASFARLLVEVDVSKELIDEIAIVLPNKRRIIQEVRYEYVPTYCETCQAIGHDTKMCARRRKQAEDQRIRIGAKAVSHKPNAASSELASLKVSTNPTFDASTSKSSKAQNIETICEESEDGFVEYLSKNRKKALAKGKKQVGFEGSLDIEEISAGINKAASRWQRKASVPRETEPSVGTSGGCIGTGGINPAGLAGDPVGSEGEIFSVGNNPAGLAGDPVGSEGIILSVASNPAGLADPVGSECINSVGLNKGLSKGTRVAEQRVVEGTSSVVSHKTRSSLSIRDKKKGGNLPRSFR